MRRTRGVGLAIVLALIGSAFTADVSSAKALKTCLTPGQQVITRTKMAYFRTAPGTESPLIVKYGPGVSLTIEGTGCPTVVVAPTGMKQYWYEASNGSATGWIAGNRIELPVGTA
jgi:hypothetical protein